MLSIANNTTTSRRSGRERYYTERGQDLYGVNYYSSPRSSSRTSRASRTGSGTSEDGSSSRPGTIGII